MWNGVGGRRTGNRDGKVMRENRERRRRRTRTRSMRKVVRMHI